MDGHGGTEHAEDNVRPPLDVGEGRSDKEREGKVEDPVGSRGKTDTFGAVFQRKDLGAIDPCGRGLTRVSICQECTSGREHAYPGQAVNTNED